MFEEAIKKANKYTRCINTIQRAYKSEKVLPVSSTIFFVNDEGCAICSKRTMDMLVAGDNMFKIYHQFLEEKKNLHDDYRYEMELEELEEKYKLKDNVICDMKNTFVGCFVKIGGFECVKHPKYDLALIRFKDYENKLYQGHAVFTKNKGPLQPGQFLCRLGYPFPEFTNYKYDTEKDEIVWTKEGNFFSPSFPQEGMVTRNVVDDDVNFAIELSTPSFNGMAGGPLFDQFGIVYGMQFQTIAIPNANNPIPYHLFAEGQDVLNSTHPFALLSRCLHADVIKKFLKDNGVKYYEEDSYGRNSCN